LSFEKCREFEIKTTDERVGSQ